MYIPRYLGRYLPIVLKAMCIIFILPRTKGGLYGGRHFCFSRNIFVAIHDPNSTIHLGRSLFLTAPCLLSHTFETSLRPNQPTAVNGYTVALPIPYLAHASQQRRARLPPGPPNLDLCSMQRSSTEPPTQAAKRLHFLSKTRSDREASPGRLLGRRRWRCRSKSAVMGR